MIKQGLGSVDKTRYDRSLTLHGFMKDYELKWLADIGSQCKTIVEVGSWKGRSTTVLAHSNVKMYVIDTWMGDAPAEETTKEVNKKGSDSVFNEFKNNMSQQIKSGIIEIIKADSREAWKILKEKKVKADFVFIDAAHEFPKVDEDVKNYQQFVKPGGMFGGHDRFHKPIINALNKYVKGWQASKGGGSIWWKSL